MHEEVVRNLVVAKVKHVFREYNSLRDRKNTLVKNFVSVNRCRCRQFFGGAKDILPEFPQICRKTFMRQNFSLQIFCSWRYILFSSAKLP